MTHKTRNRLIAFSILALPFVMLFGFVISEAMGPLPPIPTLPNPNGYTDLVKAGEMASNKFDDYEDLSLAKLRELLDTNAGIFQIARTGLQQQCQVTLVYSDNSSVHLDQLSAVKRLAFAFSAEGRLAEMENHPDDAAKSYLDMIHLGDESARGGVMIDQLVGTAIEAIGASHLQKVVGQLDAKSSRETAATLETLDSQRQTWDDVMQQEHDWSRRAFPGLRNELAKVMAHKSLEKAFQNAEHKFEAQQIKTRQLIIDLAARAYRLEQGRAPAKVSDLVPDYLKAVPQDPLTGTNMVYLPQ